MMRLAEEEPKQELIQNWNTNQNIWLLCEIWRAQKEKKIKGCTEV